MKFSMVMTHLPVTLEVSMIVFISLSQTTADKNRSKPSSPESTTGRVDVSDYANLEKKIRLTEEAKDKEKLAQKAGGGDSVKNKKGAKKDDADPKPSEDDADADADKDDGDGADDASFDDFGDGDDDADADDSSDDGDDSDGDDKGSSKGKKAAKKSKPDEADGDEPASEDGDDDAESSDDEELDDGDV